MAKRRNLKKFIKYTSGSITGFILWEISRAKEEKRPAYDQLLANIIDLHNDIVSRISHTEPGKKSDFSEGINAILTQTDELADKEQA